MPRPRRRRAGHVRRAAARRARGRPRTPPASAPRRRPCWTLWPVRLRPGAGAGLEIERAARAAFLRVIFLWMRAGRRSRRPHRDDLALRGWCAQLLGHDVDRLSRIALSGSLVTDPGEVERLVR